MFYRLFCIAASALALHVTLLTIPAKAGQTVAISRGNGFVYLVSYVMERRGLLEARAKEIGLNDLTIVWRETPRQTEQTDELLAGRVQIVNNGVGQLIFLNDRSGGRIRGIVATANHSIALVTRDPRIQKLGDYTPADRIAVPWIGGSAHSVFLEMAAANTFGAQNWDQLSVNLAQLAGTEAYIAMQSPGHEIRSHAASSPYDALELSNVPGARQILASADLPGNPRGLLQFATTQDFAEAHPRIVEALRLATMDAVETIRKAPEQAIADYLALSRIPANAGQLLSILKTDAIEFSASPRSFMLYARHLKQTGRIKNLHASWRDYFLPLPADFPGD